MTIKIVPANKIAFEDFTHTLNTAYQDYFVPLDMSVEQLRQRVRHDDILMDGSQVALDDGQPVGIGMLGQRGTRGWIGGIGVIPPYRRQGIARKLMEALLDAARQTTIETIQLEVITENTKAHQLYTSMGFQQSRILHVAEGRPPITEPNHAYKYQNVSASMILSYYDRFHSTPNPWQREYALLEKLAPNLSGVIAVEGSEVVAYGVGIFNTTVIRFVDLASLPGKTPALRALVAYLHKRYPLADGSIINIAEDDPAWAVLFLMGYKPYLNQYELRLELR